MKTSQIARGIVGALSLAGVMGAIGCGAGYDGEGAAGEGEIGETSAALTLVGNSTAMSKIRNKASSCVVHDSTSNKDLLVVAGGNDNAGTTFFRDYEIFTPGVGWSGVANFAAAGEERSGAEMVQLSTTECLMIGGVKSGGTVLLTAHKYTHPTGWATAGALPAARDGFKAVKTGNKAAVIGGLVSGTATNTVLQWNGSTGGSAAWAAPLDASSNPILLNVARFDFAAAYSPDGEKILIAGGTDGTTRFSSVEAIKSTNLAVIAAQPTNLSTIGSPITLSAAVELPAAAFSRQNGANGSEFIVVGGQTGAAAVATINAYTVNFNASPFTASQLTGSPLTMGAVVTKPVLAPTVNGKVAVVAGETFAGGNTSRVEQYVPGATVTLDGAPITLGTARHEHVAGYLPIDGHIYTTGGGTTVNESITP